MPNTALPGIAALPRGIDVDLDGINGRSVHEIVALVPDLSRREQQVLLLVSAAQSDARIADLLNISHRTVRSHVTSLFSKLMLNSRVELALVGRAMRQRAGSP